jgi:hypothetical protein
VLFHQVMKSGHLDHLLRQAAARPVAEPPVDLASGVISGLGAGENPWVRDWRRFLLYWVPAGLLLIVLLALAVASLPHGEHQQAAAPPVFPEEQP